MNSTVTLDSPLVLPGQRTTLSVVIVDVQVRIESETVLVGCITSETPYQEEWVPLWSGTRFRQQWTQAQLAASIKAFFEAGRTLPSESLIPESAQADWGALRDSTLSGELNFVFERVSMASFATTADLVAIQSANNISTALGRITDAILSVRVEAALAQGLYLLTQFGYTFLPEEREAWNRVVAELGFTSMVHI